MKISTGIYKSLKIAHASLGDNTIIAAPTKGHIEIDHIYFVADGAVDVILRNGAVEETGPMQYGSSGTFVFDNASGNYPFELDEAKAFIIDLSAAVAVNGWVKYRLVGAF